MSDLANLQSQLDYTFRNQDLLMQALTHRSRSQVNNERLEFLGDAVLGLVIGLTLYDKFPEAAEGQLSRMRSDLVKQSTLAEVGRGLALGDYLSLGQGERKQRDAVRDTMLADSLEAIIGAIMLDGGFDAASKSVLVQFNKRLAGLALKDIRKDAKSRLQEHLQALGEPLPEYILISSIGDPPVQEFEIECRVLSLPESVRAKGNTRRQAEQEAAGLVLDSLGVEL